MRPLNNPPQTSAPSCADGCETCPLGSPLPKKDAPYEGRSLGLISLAYFVIPAAMALVLGGLLSRISIDLGALGAVGGLAVGMAVCVWGARRLGPKLAKKDCGSGELP